MAGESAEAAGEKKEGSRVGDWSHCWNGVERDCLVRCGDAMITQASDSVFTSDG